MESPLQWGIPSRFRRDEGVRDKKTGDGVGGVGVAGECGILLSGSRLILSPARHFCAEHAGTNPGVLIASTNCTFSGLGPITLSKIV